MDAADGLGRVLVLAGGLSHEREVSLRSGRRLVEALRGIEVEVEVRDADDALLPALRAQPPDLVFPVLHGSAGEGGAIRGVLELLGLPYVGATPGACRVAFDKPSAKAVVAGETAVHTPAWVALPAETFRVLGAAGVLAAILDRLGLPLVVKPAHGGSALGVSIVHSADELPAAMMHAYAYGDTTLVERHVEGVEIAVSVVDTGSGPRALPAVEIVPDGAWYDYTARYTAGTTQFFAPARLDEAVAARAGAAAVAVHTALGLRDLSRTDLIVGADGAPSFLEVNVAPGMTPTSLLPQAVEAAGSDFGLLARDLLLVASARRGERALSVPG